MVNSVSYGNPTGFQQLVNQPQSYRQQPSAANPISTTKTKSKTGKVIIGTVATAAAIAGGMVAVNKFAPNIKKLVGTIKNEQIKNGLGHLTDKVANWGGSIKTHSKSSYGWAKNKIKNLPQTINKGIDWCKKAFNSVKQKLQNTAQQAPQNS